jgi:putative transposase
MRLAEREQWADQVWTIAEYHRGLKQFCGVERCQVRAARAQRNHIGLSIRAFLRLEHHRLQTGTSWFATKLEIIRAAIRTYLTQPRHILAPTA